MSARILVVDDEELIRWSLEEHLSRQGHEVATAENLSRARELLEQRSFDLGLFDLKLPDGSGVDLLQEARRLQPSMGALMVTAYSSVDSAVKAMRNGAYDYLSKPFKMDELDLVIQRALETMSLRRTVSTELNEKQRRFGIASLVGDSEAFAPIKALIGKIAASDSSTVLLLGETGCGKDMIARAIHYESRRADKPFMNITCTAVPEALIESELFGHEEGAFTNALGKKIGLFELAHNGTVFLDEIGDMPGHLQAKLLRVLEEKSFRRVGGAVDIQVDCRIIAATHQDLQAMMRQGDFREDLFFRLNTIPIAIPPLRDRRADVLPLALHFLESFSRELGRPLSPLSEGAQQRLLDYAWPGNVRELRNVMERAVLLGVEELLASWEGLGQSKAQSAASGIDLPAGGCVLAEVEEELVRQALTRSQGNQSQAARLLGISRDQLRYRVEKYHLNAD